MKSELGCERKGVESGEKEVGKNLRGDNSFYIWWERSQVETEQ